MNPVNSQNSSHHANLERARSWPKEHVQSKRIVRARPLQALHNRVIARTPEPGRADVLKAARAVRRHGENVAQPETPELTEKYRKQALAFPEVRHDSERIAAYVAHRLKGSNIPKARQDCQYGLHYLRCSEGKRGQIRELLAQYKVSPSPLCWPRLELQLDRPLEKCPLLGEGSYNKVYGIRYNGQDYAFKPLRKSTDLENGKLPFSLRGELLGLQEDCFYPELRTVAAVRVADALGLLGPDGVLGAAWIAIVNGVPGIWEQRAFGRMEGRDVLWDEKLESGGLAGRLVQYVLNEDQSKKDPLEGVRKLGLVHARRKNDSVYLTGTWGQRSASAASRYASPSYNLNMKRAEVLEWMLNGADLHCGNVVYQRRGENQYGLKVLDTNESFPPSHPWDITFENPDHAWQLAGTAIQLIDLPPGMRQVVRSERYHDILNALCRELKGFLPENDLSPFAQRIEYLSKVDLPEFGPDDYWQADDDLDPTKRLLDFMIGFSDHAFGESTDSDSSDDEAPLPEATEIQ